MKILYIITQADGGGAQNYVLALAKHFGGTIAAGSEAAQLFFDAKNAGIPCVELRHLKRAINPFNDFLAAWEIRRLIEAEKPDIVHLNSSKAGVLGTFAAFGLKTKVIFTAHGFIFNEPMGAAKKNFYLAAEKLASGYRDYIITVSDADKNSALEHHLIASDKIATVHNGLGQINFFGGQEARRELKIADNKIIIGAVANCYKTKGLDVLIDAVALMNGQIKSKIQIVIIGDGPEIENLKLEIENLRLENTIKLLGKINGAARYLRAFDCFILPSRKEGFPYAILEAMQAGLPIIATNVGGVPEALSDAGITINPQDPEALAEAMEHLIADKTKQSELSQKASQRSKLFTEEKMFAETEKVYNQILK